VATFGTLTLRAMAIPFCCRPGQAVEGARVVVSVAA
jgi:hypothetical protein